MPSAGVSQGGPRPDQVTEMWNVELQQGRQPQTVEPAGKPKKNCFLHWCCCCPCSRYWRFFNNLLVVWCVFLVLGLLRFGFRMNALHEKIHNMEKGIVCFWMEALVAYGGKPQLLASAGKHCLLPGGSIFCFRREALFASRGKHCLLPEGSISCFWMEVLFVSEWKYCLLPNRSIVCFRLE